MIALIVIAVVVFGSFFAWCLARSAHIADGVELPTREGLSGYREYWDGDMWRRVR
jgi:hypothetical protein